MIAKSIHMMQSAPVGLLHAQLCIGGLVYSWDQSADGEGKQTYVHFFLPFSLAPFLPCSLSLFLSWLFLVAYYAIFCSGFAHLLDKKQTVRIPVKIYHIRKRWVRAALEWLKAEGMTKEGGEVR